jgi:hypothetical protein
MEQRGIIVRAGIPGRGRTTPGTATFAKPVRAAELAGVLRDVAGQAVLCVP